MAFASGGYHGAYYYPEATFGVTPATPVWVPLRHTSCGLSLKRDEFECKELTATREATLVRLGTYKIEGSLEFCLSYGTFDTLLQGLMGGTWAPAYALTGLNVAVDAVAKTFTRDTGSFVTAGVEVGDWITTDGFVQAGNNGTFLVSNVSALVITCSTAINLVNEAGGGDEQVTTSRYILRQGTSQRSFSILRRFTDITQYHCFSGCVVNKLALTVKPNAIIMGTFDFIGSNLVNSLPAGSTYAAATTSIPMDAFSSSLEEGGASSALVSSLDLTMENGCEADYVIGSRYAPQISWGRAKCSGKISAFFEDLALYNKFLNETASTLKFTASDGTQTISFYMANVKYISADNPATEEKPILLEMDFRGQHLATYTCLQIDRNPGNIKEPPSASPSASPSLSPSLSPSYSPSISPSPS